MDDSRVLPASLYRDVRAFLNVLRSSCANCMRRRCESCDLNGVDVLIARLDSARTVDGADIHRHVNLPNYVSRYISILRQLRESGEPLLCSNIQTERIGSHANKWNALHRLAGRGLVKIVENPIGKTKSYMIAPGKEDAVDAIIRNGTDFRR